MNRSIYSEDATHLYVLSSGLYRLHEDHTFDRLHATRYRNDQSDENDEATSNLPVDVSF